MASDQQLRDMAEHRGLRLIRSRRRKPGVGDYGKFGLTDASGKAMLGIGADGLTASAEDVEAFLRGDAAGSWKASADVLPDAPAPKGKSDKAPQPPPGSRRQPARAQKPAKAAAVTRNAEPALAKSAPKDKPQPKLAVREAEAGDAKALLALINQLRGVKINAATLGRSIASLQETGGGMLIADLDGTVGCCAWAIMVTPHRDRIGRITALIVDRAHRRRGIGSQLLADVVARLGKSGCSTVEAMSDIDIQNAHNFFRAAGFTQTSYRFARAP